MSIKGVCSLIKFLYFLFPDSLFNQLEITMLMCVAHVLQGIATGEESILKMNLTNACFSRCCMTSNPSIIILRENINLYATGWLKIDADKRSKYSIRLNALTLLQFHLILPSTNDL
ncbi:unnamed protein product [Orchesella dallaii]|uniref:Secreted protein n=1 Tax=Orchesella dallaii TaxID=48710 RepID=A0ABP1PNT2_9HEXA